MAEASPIGRGKNLTLETILTFLDAIPQTSKPKNTFLSYGEARMKGWRQTHSQIARQLALYYEDENGICHPRFKHRISPEEAANYGCNWARKYFVPNPFTPSLSQYKGKETNIYAFIRKRVLEGNNSFSDICHEIYDTELNNLDKDRVYLSNFTDLIISDDAISINESVLDYKAEIIYPIINSDSTSEYFHYFDDAEQIKNTNTTSMAIEPLQLIYYGAPGTGKSYKIDTVTDEDNSIRTTFHPDSDYSSFVGAYKPTIESTSIHYISEGEVKYASSADNPKAAKGVHPGTENKMVYKFIPQAFLKAYVKAWSNLEKPFYLVIEEINRGNCAQIFGDLFQLLDRNESGSSSYSIQADDDIARYLNEDGFFQLNSDKKLAILSFRHLKDNGEEQLIGDKILNGEILLLPPNLRIWATMNTSDQSLFPIDSAFKRRWDWKYIKIADSGKDYRITVNGKEYDWWKFLEAINKHIGETTSQEDKKLGYFFVKATKDKNGKHIISADKFLSKVLFFLYGDVYKDYGFDDEIFNGEDGKSMEFSDYFDEKGDASEPKIEKFLQNLKLKPIESTELTSLTNEAAD